MITDGLWDVYENFHMGQTGELVAEKYGITRQEQDQFAFDSHRKAVRAIKSCFVSEQIVPVEIKAAQGRPGSDQRRMNHRARIRRLKRSGQN